MAGFLIQRTVGVADVGTEVAALRAVAASMTACAQPLRVLHATYVSADQSCLCLVDADDAATVLEALRRAGAHVARVLPALSL